MTYWCDACSRRIRVNWPHGKKSTKAESGHKEDCKGYQKGGRY